MPPKLDFLGDLERTHMCGTLRVPDAGSRAVLMGWVSRRRDLGNLIFIDLRDRSGITQVVFNNELNPAIHEKAATLRSEFVIAVKGVVKRRDSDTVNEKISTGEIELAVGGNPEDALLLLNDSKTPPFSPAEDAIGNEETRLKYRYIDLRRPAMQTNIEMRHKIALAIREYLSSQGFLEIETPFMTRSTPEGARDYLVPSRVHWGAFYALPQSPQIFKQILMISGFDKYFQIVRCFRDEDLRADRQPEFTQIDLEMSFPSQERVFRVVEGFLSAAFQVAGNPIVAPFPRMTYDDAIRLYGIDKPDMRLPAMADVRGSFSSENLAELAIDADLPVALIRIPSIGELSRKERDDIRTLLPPKSTVKVFDDFKRLERGFPDAIAAIRKLVKAEEGDLLVLVAAPRTDGAQGSCLDEIEAGASRGSEATRVERIRRNRIYSVFTAAGQLRLALAQKYAERHKAFEKIGAASDYKFLWVTDFPMFEYHEESSQWDAAHHPFTSPHEHDMDNLEADPGAVRALAYDVVLNGIELGSGSIRIHRQDIQKRIFRALGMSDEEARSRFGFFLEALEYGTPPHGGIALGLDRIAMLLAGATSLREVIPFPKTAKAVDLMVDAPTPVSPAQLRELHIRTFE